MFKGMNLATLATALDTLVGESEDYIADTRRMGFYVDDAPRDEKDKSPRSISLTIDQSDQPFFTVLDHTQQQMASRLGVPTKFWDRMRDDHPDILTDTVTKLMMREPEVRMVRTVNTKARAYLSNRYKRLDNYDLMERAIAPALHDYGQSGRVLSCGLTDTRMYVKVLFPDVQFDDPRGGGAKVFGGVYVGNSEVGAGALVIEPFTYADFCTNGMIFGKQTYADFGLRKTHLGRMIDDDAAARAMGVTEATMAKEDEAFFSLTYDLIKGAASGIHFAAIAESMQRAAGIKVGGDPVAIVEKLAKATNVTEKESGSIMRHLIEGGDLSAWGYANAITRTAEDADSYDRSTELERLGGDIVEWSEQAWAALAAQAAIAA